MATQGTAGSTQASSRAGQMSREEEKGEGRRTADAGAACSSSLRQPPQWAVVWYGCCPAEHFVAFLMNYQDTKTLKNKYIDQLVRRQLLLAYHLSRVDA